MARNINVLIGERVRAAREAAELSLLEIVNSMRDPITLQQLARYETGKSRWPADLLIEVAGILKIDVRALCAEEKEQAHG